MSNYWKTPLHVLEPIENFYKKQIDLDPFFGEGAFVKAKNYYTEKDNGLEKPWFGAVFANPPYGSPFLELTTKKAASERDHCEILLLIPAYTSTKWFQKYVFGEADAILFYNKRISFVGLKKGSPTFHSCLVCYSNRILDFYRYFNMLGTIIYPRSIPS